jgi:hypothetical protein
LGQRLHRRPQAKLDKLDAVLAQTSTRIEDAALFAEMLSRASLRARRMASAFSRTLCSEGFS